MPSTLFKKKCNLANELIQLPAANWSLVSNEEEHDITYLQQVNQRSPWRRTSAARTRRPDHVPPSLDSPFGETHVSSEVIRGLTKRRELQQMKTVPLIYRSHFLSYFQHDFMNTPVTKSNDLIINRTNDILHMTKNRNVNRSWRF